MLDKFAKLLGIRRDQAEDALQSERAAKLVVSRRSFLGVGAALATGALFSFPGVEAAPAPGLTYEKLMRFDSALRAMYPPLVAFMNPTDYAALSRMLGTSPPDELVISEPHVAPGTVLRLDLSSFKNLSRLPTIDRRSLDVG